MKNSNAPAPSETFSRFDEQYRCRHRSCIFSHPSRLIPETRKKRRRLRRVLSFFPRLFALGEGCDGEAKDERRGLAASVVTSANPIVDNLRLIVPVTRQTHTPPARDTRKKRQGGVSPRTDILYSRDRCAQKLHPKMTPSVKCHALIFFFRDSVARF